MRWLASCFLFLSSFYCTAQQYYEPFTPANGLVDARVNKLIQGSDGRIFFLTRDGISIYDGQRFINHTKLNDTPIGIVEDGILLPNGNLRLATFDGKWITIKKNSTHLAIDSAKLTAEVSSVIPLSENEYLVISNYGLFLHKEAEFIPLLTNSYRDGKRRILENVTAANNAIIVNYNNDKNHFVYAYNKNTGIATDSTQIVAVRSMATDNDKNIFLCTPTAILQLNRLLLQKGKIKIEKPWFQKHIPATFKTDKLFFDRQGNIWLINYTGGCCKINPITNEVSYYSSKDGLFQGLTSIFQDNENNYWFIAKGKGVQKLIQTNLEILERIKNKEIEQVTLVSTTEDSSLVLFTSNDISVLNETRIIQADPVYSFFWQNNFWNYTSDNLLVNDIGKQIHITAISSPDTATYFPSPYTTIDKKGNLLIAGNRFVLFQKNFTAISYNLPYFCDNIVADDDNNYWVFCRSNHILKFRLNDNKFEKKAGYLHPGIQPRFAIHWNKDTFLIASRLKGVLIAKVTEKSVAIIGQLTRQQGLSNDFVETLLKIDDYRIAAGTAAGLDIITFAGSDTLIENISSRINHFEPILQLARDRKGYIYARTENLQLFKFDPSAFTTPPYNPGAWISEVIINGKSVSSDAVVFNHRQNNFHFAVSSPSFIDSRNIVFRFNLAGENVKWQQRSNKADFEINNLPPGNYTLSVTIKYPGTIYRDKTISYSFRIRPPFWKTWWFISTSIFILILLIYLFIHSYLQRQLEKQKIIMEKELAIEHERTRMARELHDGLGSMLSGVKHSFTAIQKQMNLDEQQEERFQYNIDKLNESIVELRDISHSMASESLLKYGLENSLRDYCRNINQPGEFTISFEALGTSDLKLTDEQSFHIFRIVQELIQNIIKHASTSTAIVQLSYNHGFLYVTVEDNGKGFIMTDREIKKGIGLKNIESRVKTLNGKMDFRSVPNEGTSVLIEIPC